MEVISFKEFQNILDRLKERDQLSSNNIIMYVVSPLIKSLGYDVFNIDEVLMDIEEREIVLTVEEEMKILLLVNQNDLSQSGHSTLDKEDVKMYVSLDINNKKILVYYKVLGAWESVLDFDIETGDSETYAQEFVKRLSKDQIKREMASNGTRFLTDKVINTRLEEGDWENEFMKAGLLKELESPSDEFIEVMASRLVKDYTTQEQEWVKEKIEGAKEIGFLRIIKELTKQGKLEVEEVVETEVEPDDQNEEPIEDTDEALNEGQDGLTGDEMPSIDTAEKELEYPVEQEEEVESSVEQEKGDVELDEEEDEDEGLQGEVEIGEDMASLPELEKIETETESMETEEKEEGRFDGSNDEQVHPDLDDLVQGLEPKKEKKESKENKKDGGIEEGKTNFQDLLNDTD